MIKYNTTQQHMSVVFLTIILIALAVSPAFALGDGNRNLLLIGVMFLSPILLIFYHKFDKLEVILFFFLLSIFFIPAIYHPESFRSSTVLYSYMFGLTFITYISLLYQNTFTPYHYKKLLKYLIYAYFIVLLIQQFDVLFGLPIFNVSAYDSSEPWKLNSLAAEPSHSARIVALLMYCYLIISEVISNKTYDFRENFNSDKWIWLAFLWTMLTMGSATAFLFLIIVLSKFMKLKQLLILIVLFIIIIILINFLNVNTFERTFKVFFATLSLDPHTIIKADHSASIRIVPMLFLADRIDFTSLDGWFGHGIDYVSTFMYKLVPGVKQGFSAGGMFQLWMEYGFLSFFLFVIFSFLATYNKYDFRSVLFWFFLVFMYGVNSQIVWLTIILLNINKDFYKNKQKIEG